MDIGGLSGNMAATQAALNNASANKLERNMKSDYSKAGDDELMDACKQFEAYFVEQMYKEMIKTIPKNEDSTGSMNTMMDFYKDQMVQNLATETTNQDNLGLAKMLYEQMKRNYGDVE